MKSELRDQKKPAITYPCLKKSFQSGAIVLFSSLSEGTVVVQGVGSFKLGQHYDGFASENFEVLSDSYEVVLKN